MTNFIIGFILGIVVLFLFICITAIIGDRSTAKRIRKEIGEDFEVVYMPKSKLENLMTEES